MLDGLVRTANWPGATIAKAGSIIDGVATVEELGAAAVENTDAECYPQSVSMLVDPLAGGVLLFLLDCSFVRPQVHPGDPYQWSLQIPFPPLKPFVSVLLHVEPALGRCSRCG